MYKRKRNRDIKLEHRSKLLYGMEGWNNENWKHQEAFERRMLKIKLTDKITNETIIQRIDKTRESSTTI